MNRMFEAAERNGMKLIVGLYPGDYSKKDTTTPEQYEFLIERNKQVFDELFSLWGNLPILWGGSRNLLCPCLPTICRRLRLM